MTRVSLGAGLRMSLVTTGAALAGFAVMYALCTRYGAGPAPAVLAAALCVGLMRRPEPLDTRTLAVKLVAVPLIALVAGSVGLTLLKAPLIGAIVFSCAVASSIWLRNFGKRAAVIGRIIALPLLTLLVVPVRVGGNGVTALFVLAAGGVALVMTIAGSWIAVRLGATLKAPAKKAARPQREGAIPIATRMALQMLVALALAFAFGMWLFRVHWPWVVLTAFIVCSGTIAREDAVYKALLRLTGAVAGTLAGSLTALVVFPTPAAYAAAIFIILLFGIWLRGINYVYWAACATLIFALLQGAHGAHVFALLGERIVAIGAGAVCAVAAVWCVYPVRTEQLVRRRVADALIALRYVVAANPDDPAHGERLATLGQHVESLEGIAPPARLHRAVFRARNDEAHPAALVERVLELLNHASEGHFDRAHTRAEMHAIGALLRDTKP